MESDGKAVPGVLNRTILLTLAGLANIIVQLYYVLLDHDSGTCTKFGNTVVIRRFDVTWVA